MSKVKIRLCITTMNENIQKVLEYFSKFAEDDCTIHIGHQITNGSQSLSPERIPKYIYYYPMYEKGLSKNRNNILKHLNDGIYVLCDDDIKLNNGFKENIQKAYNSKKGKCITFQSIVSKGGELRKKYPKYKKKHNKISILSVSSIEITFDIKTIKKKNIKFNENFGLGTKNPSGEENIFLKEALDKKIPTIYIPNVINIHERQSSGSKYKTEQDITTKIKVFKHMYGYLGALVAVFYFTILHHKLYKKNFSIGNFFILSIKSL